MGNVLLLEDNPGDVRLTKEMFKEAGLSGTPHVVTDRDRAWAFLHRRGEYADAPRPDLILLDWYFGGGGMLSELRNDPTLEEVPVVVLTGTRTELRDLEDSDTGAADHVLKPIEPTECRSLADRFSVAQ